MKEEKGGYHPIQIKWKTYIDLKKHKPEGWTWDAFIRSLLHNWLKS